MLDRAYTEYDYSEVLEHRFVRPGPRMGQQPTLLHSLGDADLAGIFGLLCSLTAAQVMQSPQRHVKH